MKRLLASLLTTFLFVVSYAHAETLTGVTDEITWTYEGDVVNGKPHGQGTTAYANGDKYIGEWKAGNFHGQGTYTWPDGDKHVGQYQDGDRHGQGTYTWVEGTKYVGDYKDDLPHGQGTRTWTDGEMYTGEWKEGKEHGQGTYRYASGAKYVGESKYGRPHGQGTYIFASGAKYVGEYKHGRRHGQGVMTYSDGEIYSGEWKDDTEHSEGGYTHVDAEADGLHVASEGGGGYEKLSTLGMQQRLIATAEQFKDIGPLTRTTQFDMAYPRNAEEYGAMNGVGILWVTAHSQVPEELPLNNMRISTAGAGNIELEAYSWFLTIEEDELVASVLGRNRVDAVYLVPFYKEVAGASLLVDYAINRTDFFITQFEASFPDKLGVLKSLYNDEMKHPETDVFLSMLNREYPISISRE